MHIDKKATMSFESIDEVTANFVEELTQALEAGESIDLEVLKRKHPIAAKQVDELLPILKHLHQLNPGGQTDSSLDNGILMERRLGDFQIKCEIGRGGMGIIYEAEQISLKRRVALKVLPFASVLDDQRLARFKIEAQAAAGLHHENIVPVYSIGCEQGIHYYAMQFIKGKTLADLAQCNNQSNPSEISETPSTNSIHVSSEDASLKENPVKEKKHLFPQNTLYRNAETDDFRKVARLGLQAANALQYAHECGVVHRDIKPSNLLLNDSGHLWIADFGLALIRSDDNLTTTGAIAGTLHYMSPEQIRGDRAVLDERTDIYSLGVTFYEVLTGNVAFNSSAHDLLIKEITELDPLTPRQLIPGIPIDLETIILKAMRKDPNERYQSAVEMADDLQRFLEDRPILARQPTLKQKASRWARRHQAIVWAGIVILFVSTIAMSTSLVLIQQAFQLEVTQRERAEEEQSRANKEWKRAEANAKEFKIQRDLAEKEKLRAEGNIWIAMEGLDSVTKTMMQRTDIGMEFQNVKLQALEVAWTVYRRFEHINGFHYGDRRRATLGSNSYFLLCRMAEINTSLGQYDQAIGNYQKAIQTIDQHKLDHPVTENFCFYVSAQTYQQLAEVQRIVNQFSAAEKSLQHANQRISKIKPEQERTEPVVRTLEQVKEFNNAMKAAIPRMQARSQMQLGFIYYESGRISESEPLFVRALADLEALVEDAKCDEHDRHVRIQLFESLGRLYLRTSRPQDASRILQRACDLQKTTVISREALLSNHHALACAFEQLGEFGQAEESFRTAIQLAEQLERDFPGQPQKCDEHAHCLLSFANFLRKRGRSDESLKVSQKAVMIFNELVSEYSQIHEYRYKLGLALNTHGLDLNQQNELVQAESVFDRSKNIALVLLEKDKKNGDYHGLLGVVLKNLAKLKIAQGDHDKAHRLLKEARLYQKSSVETYPNHSAYQKSLAEILKLLESVSPTHDGGDTRISKS